MREGIRRSIQVSIVLYSNTNTPKVWFFYSSYPLFRLIHPMISSNVDMKYHLAIFALWAVLSYSLVRSCHIYK